MHECHVLGWNVMRRQHHRAKADGYEQDTAVTPAVQRLHTLVPRMHARQECVQVMCQAYACREMNR